jgi:two-component system, OmpR family, response regulator
LAKILLVEDDKLLSNNIREWLTMQNHTVEAIHNGRDAIDMLKTYRYDAIILDWGLPGADGIDVLKAFRDAGGKSPVLFLTGKDKTDDKAAGLDSGADDYLTKPFHIKELSARLRALLRRPPDEELAVVKVRDLEINFSQHTVTRDSQPIKLMRKEYALLEFLARHPNTTFSAEAIIERVWPADRDINPLSLRTYVTRLRAKLDDKSQKESIIETVHGEGYKLVL